MSLSPARAVQITKEGVLPIPQDLQEALDLRPAQDEGELP
jgi:hypothetical protein